MKQCNDVKWGVIFPLTSNIVCFESNAFEPEIIFQNSFLSTLVSLIVYNWSLLAVVIMTSQKNVGGRKSLKIIFVSYEHA